MPGSKPGERRGGRKKGTPNKATAEIREHAQQYTVEALEGLAQIARTSESDAAKVSAWKAILDRGHGRPVVSIDAQVDTQITVVTGVPKRDALPAPELAVEAIDADDDQAALPN